MQEPRDRSSIHDAGIEGSQQADNVHMKLEYLRDRYGDPTDQRHHRDLRDAAPCAGPVGEGWHHELRRVGDNVRDGNETSKRVSTEKTEDNMLLISTDGRKVALDLRLLAVLTSTVVDSVDGGLASDAKVAPV